MGQHTLYHSILRIASLTCALVLVFESGLLSPATKDISKSAHQYLASAIGINATVAPNELNQLTAELTAQRQKLAEREAALKEREIAIGLNTQDNSSSNTVFILSVVLFIMLVLILLNYVLDYMRSTAVKQQAAHS